MKYIRRWLYRRGYRPKYPSMFFSPTLHLIYAMKDAQKSHHLYKDLYREVWYGRREGPEGSDPSGQRS